LAAAAALTAAAPAGAAIVLDRGMAGVTLGTSDTAAIATLGSPTSGRAVRDRNGSLEVRRYFKGPKVKYVATRPDPSDGDLTVTTFVTRRGSERTADGLGVGTAERTLKAKIPGLTCETRRLGGPPVRECFTKGRAVPDSEIGRDQTVFTISRRTRLTTRVEISRFYD
ncbi:MAG TPA: hypothetical protein VN238_03025, partial [Solirubrobacteraceae bacterium]|nr:hypothetical protein [Solirubrobacteraceae bacterium]